MLDNVLENRVLCLQKVSDRGCVSVSRAEQTSPAKPGKLLEYHVAFPAVLLHYSQRTRGTLLLVQNFLKWTWDVAGLSLNRLHVR